LIGLKILKNQNYKSYLLKTTVANLLPYFILLFLLFSCKKDDLKWNLKKTPELGSATVTYNNNSSFEIEAECLSIGYDKNVQMGFCWSTNSEPDLNDNVIILDKHDKGKFKSIINWTSESKYYLRAFVKNNISTVYSLLKIVNWPGDLSLPTIHTDTIVNVSFNSLTVNCSDGITNGQPILNSGVIISTSPSPDFSNASQIIYSNTSSFSTNFEGLNENTSYYARGFITTISGIGFGNILSKTLPKKYNINDIGPAGGIIFYENPDIFGQWHYLEVSSGDISGIRKWSPYSSTTNVISQQIGDGKSNTLTIVNILGTQNYAAYNAFSLQQSGFNDWFLPSFEELKLMKSFFYDQGIGGFLADSYYWSSSEDANFPQNAWTVKMSNGGSNLFISQSKLIQFKVRPIRKF
jgi:hypothetical protein